MFATFYGEIRRISFNVERKSAPINLHKLIYKIIK